MPRLGREQEEVLLLYEPYRREIGIPQPEKTIMPVSAVATKPKPFKKPKVKPKGITVEQFEKKYNIPAPKTIPKEAIITKVTEVKGEYTIEYVEPAKPEPKATWQETTIAGAISQKGLVSFFAELLAPYLPEEKRQPYLESMAVVSELYEPKVVPISSKTFAGFIAGPEKYYRMARGEPAPPMPVSSLISVGLGDPKELIELEKAGTQFGVGALFWEIGEAYVIGKGVEKLGKKLIPESIKHAAKFGKVAKATYKAKLTVKSVLPSFRGSRVDVWMAKHFKPYYAKTGIARGEVALTQIPERIGLTHLEAGQLAWKLTEAPRTSGVWLRSVGFAPAKTKVLPHLISRGGQVSVGYLKTLSIEEPYWQRGLLPYVTQTQVTRMGIIPYTPKIVSGLGKKATLTPLLGLAVVSIPKLRKDVWQPTYAHTKETLRILTLEKPTLKQRKKLIPIHKVSQLEKQISKLETLTLQTQKQRQIQKQEQRQLQRMGFPKTPQLAKEIKLPTMRIPELFRKKRKKKRIGEEWFWKKHELMTVKEVAQSFSLPIPGTRRKKRRKK